MEREKKKNLKIKKYAMRCNDRDGEKCPYVNNGYCELFDIELTNPTSSLHICNAIYGGWYTGHV